MDMIYVKIIGTCSEMQDTNGYHPAADSTSDLAKVQELGGKKAKQHELQSYGF